MISSNRLIDPTDRLEVRKHGCCPKTFVSCTNRFFPPTKRWIEARHCFGFFLKHIHATCAHGPCIRSASDATNVWREPAPPPATSFIFHPFNLSVISYRPGGNKGTPVALRRAPHQRGVRRRQGRMKVDRACPNPFENQPRRRTMATREVRSGRLSNSVTWRQRVHACPPTVRRGRVGVMVARGVVERMILRVQEERGAWGKSDLLQPSLRRICWSQQGRWLKGSVAILKGTR